MATLTAKTTLLRNNVGAVREPPHAYQDKEQQGQWSHLFCRQTLKCPAAGQPSVAIDKSAKATENSTFSVLVFSAAGQFIVWRRGRKSLSHGLS
jgi:hypothetical protein